MYTKNSLNSFFAVVAFFLMLLPFFSLYPIHTDVQPMFLLFVVLALLTAKGFRFGYVEAAFCFVFLYSLFFRDFLSGDIDFRKMFGLPIAFISFYFSRKYSYLLTNKLIFFVSTVTFFSVVLHYFFPEVYIKVAANFVRDIKVSDVSGSRGASGLAPEPGFTGALAVTYLAIALYNYRYKAGRSYLFLIAILCVAVIFFTKSGTGYALIILFLSFFILGNNFRSYFYFLVFLLLTYFFVEIVDFGRGASLVSSLLESPEEVLSRDESLGKRLINIMVGFLVVFENPLGYGGGSFHEVSSAVISKHNLLETFAGEEGNVSAFALYSVEIGLVFWCLLFIFFVKAIKHRKMAFFALGACFILASFSIVFPPAWILMALVCDRCSYARKR